MVTAPGDLAARARRARGAPGIEIESAEVTAAPETRVAARRGRSAAKLIRLIDALEENDDVSAVHANFDVSAEVLEKVVG